MLRLAAKLGAESDASKQDTDHTSDTTYASAPEYQDPMLIDGREHVREPIGIPPVQKTAESPILSQSPARKHKATKKRGNKSKKSVDSRFVTKNAFDALQGPPDTDAEQDEDEEQTPPYDPEHEQQGDGFWVGKEFPQPEPKDYPIVTRTREPMEMMPDFNSDFWHSFGNRLRVFGTQELVLQVAEWEGKRVRKVEEYRD
jgi:poly(A)-specific ribonuclease